jgi:chromosome segregation ATPase
MKNVKEIFEGLDGLDERSVEFLSKAISKSNLPGFDYLEFKQSIKAMSEMDLDKASKYKSAFATATTLGLDKKKLIETAQHYKTVLEKEKKQFDAALGKQINQKISSRKSHKEKLLEEKKMLEEKIVQMQERLGQMDGKISEAEKAIEEAEGKINEARSKFESTYTRFLDNIGDDIEYIKNTLK